MPKLIAVAGASGSGKTYLARELARAFGDAVILEHDRYYRDQAHFPPADRARVNYDHPDALETPLFESDLKTLLAGQPIKAPQYDFTLHTRKPARQRIKPAPHIIAEGIHALGSPVIRDLASLTVFVDTAPDICFIRRLQRDTAERGRTAEAVIRRYMQTVRPMFRKWVQPARAYADLVLDGEEAVEVNIARIRAGLDTP
jgi:uridine kinase